MYSIARKGSNPYWSFEHAEIIQPYENQPMASPLQTPTKSVVCDEVSSTRTKTEMDATILKLFKIFFVNRLQRYLSRVVYMFRQISYLEPELRAFTCQEKIDPSYTIHTNC